MVCYSLSWGYSDLVLLTLQLLRTMLTNWFSPPLLRRLILGSTLGFAGVIYLKVVIPVFHFGIPCVFSEVTGLECPGCGMTRAILAVLDLNFYQAFRYNSLLFVLPPLYLTYSLLKNRGFKRTSSILMLLMLVLTVSYGILRNIPMFDWLEPTKLI
jgi:hypothetical protein